MRQANNLTSSYSSKDFDVQTKVKIVDKPFIKYINVAYSMFNLLCRSCKLLIL